MFLNEYKIIKNEHLKNRFYRMIIQSHEIASQAEPGQFIHIQVENTIHPILRRPFSIYRTESTLIEILYEVIGEGTQILAQKQRGMYINTLGPLGNSFSYKQPIKKALLIGGGIGNAPLLFLGERLLAKGIPVDVILGYRSKNDVVADDDFIIYGMKPIITTDDGTCGMKGNVIAPLKDILTSDHTIFACGPIPMLKAVNDYSISTGNPCEVSIHNHMGCGFGVCLGCVFPSQKGYVRVCKEGPIFNGKELVFG